ncbi:UNVERIFIED_CONTAM: hypothetical protein Slati_3928800, partial [Sesamum latifolium]
MFTWCNHREAPNTVRVRLNRVCAALEWQNMFPNFWVTSEVARGSDHNPLVIDLNAARDSELPFRRRVFRFEAMWMRSAECEALIQELWNSEASGDAGSRLAACTHQATSITRRRVHSELEEFLSREEIMWKQRGKAQWLSEGDRNTPYFHAQASGRRQKNSITRLWDKNGDWCSTSEGIQGIISTYFADLFQTSSPSEEAMDEIIRGMPAKVTGEMNEVLTQPFSSDEVTLAISQMYPCKSPGPDGMFSVFYQKYWHIVGPKCESPENMSHFRPISLCNITYKIASIMIANRLKPILLIIVSESQSAFISGSLISDNVLVVYEQNHYLAHKTWGSVGHVALKLDLSKAYDRMEWIFLERVLAKLETLSSTITRAIERRELRGVVVSRQDPRVSHLLFADDTLVFFQASFDAMRSVRQILRDFEAASGLMVNFDKSSVAFSRNVLDEHKTKFVNILGIQ